MDDDRKGADCTKATFSHPNAIARGTLHKQFSMGSTYVTSTACNGSHVVILVRHKHGRVPLGQTVRFEPAVRQWGNEFTTIEIVV
jgi:hypothetical protein